MPQVVVALPQISVYTGVTGPITNKHHASMAARESLRHIAEYWRTVILPKHFTKAGEYEYGYFKRNPGYQKHKMNPKKRKPPYPIRQNPPLPLVYTGKTRDTALNRSRVTATQFKSVVRIPVASYIMFNKHHGDVLADEITRVSPREARKLAGMFKDEFLRLMARERTLTTTKNPISRGLGFKLVTGIGFSGTVIDLGRRRV